MNWFSLLIVLLVPNFAAAASTMVSGDIYQGKTPYTSQTDFVFTPTSQAEVKLESCLNMADASDCKLISAQNMVVTAFPIHFSLAGFATDKDCQGERICSLSVKISSQGDLKALHVGDLLNEYQIDVKTLGGYLVVVATGLESCQDKNAGGFCL